MFTYKNIILFRIIVLLVLAAFSGCVTSKIEYVEKEELPDEKVYYIISAYLKDGSTVDLKDKKAEVKFDYKGVKNVILYYDEGFKEKHILFKDIAWLKIEVVENNKTVTTIVIIGSVVIALFLAFVVVLGIGLSSH